MYTGDEHEGAEDRPAAVIVRVDYAVTQKVLRALDLMATEGYLRIAVPLDADEVRWIKTVGYQSDDTLSRVPAARSGEPDWMAAQAPAVVLDDVFENHLDDGDACEVYESPSEPIVGTTCIEISRDGPAADGEDTPVYFAVCGTTFNYRAESFMHRVSRVWPHLVTTDTERQGPRERQAA